jgi:hypothetical protein
MHRNRITLTLLFVTLLVTSSVTIGGEFKPYPGARIDEKATQESRRVTVESGMPGIHPTIYTTSDPFEKVYAFYQGMAKEYQMPGRAKGKPKMLPSGQELKEAYFILDGAGDLMSSKLWVKVQRPYIGEIKLEGRNPKYEDVRDLTAIVVSEKK